VPGSRRRVACLTPLPSRSQKPRSGVACLARLPSCTQNPRSGGAGRSPLPSHLRSGALGRALPPPVMSERKRPARSASPNMSPRAELAGAQRWPVESRGPLKSTRAACCWAETRVPWAWGRGRQRTSRSAPDSTALVRLRGSLHALAHARLVETPRIVRGAPSGAEGSPDTSGPFRRWPARHLSGQQSLVLLCVRISYRSLL
jgi:hypothetical protein